MELLSGKCKTDFEQYLTERNDTPWVAFFVGLPVKVQNIYYVDFFDAHLISINVILNETGVVLSQIVDFKEEKTYEIQNILDNGEKIRFFGNRQEACKEAIKKANNLYNSKCQK